MVDINYKYVHDTFFADALVALRPGAEWTCIGDTYSGLTWHDKTQTKPSESEVTAKIAELKKEYEDTKYQRQRANEYPDWGTQLDYIYHNGIDKWKTDIVYPVKAKYPKPE